MVTRHNRRNLAAARWTIGVVSCGVLAAVTLPASGAQPRIRKEQSLGVCVAVPTKWFPKSGKTTVEERTVDLASGPTEIAEATHRITGTKDRAVIIWLSAVKYELSVTGWSAPVNIEFVTPTAYGERTSGYWDPETEEPEGGPWYGRAFRLKNDAALKVEVYLRKGDEASKSDIDAMLNSIRRC